MTSRQRFGAVDIALLAVAATWGSSYLSAKSTVTPDTVLGFLALRFGIAVCLLTVLLAPRLRQTSLEELRLGALYGAILAVVFLLETFGVTDTTASNAGLIISLTMLMTPWLEATLKRQRLSHGYVAAVLLALTGVALLTQAEGLAAPTWGDLLILAAAAVRAIHVTVIDHTTTPGRIDTARVTLIQLATVMVSLGLLASTVSTSPVSLAATFSATQWITTIYLAVLCTVFAFFVQIWAVRRTSPSRVSLLLGTEPLWAAVMGISMGGEPLTLAVIAGAACILAGTTVGRTTQLERLEPAMETEPELVGVNCGH